MRNNAFSIDNFLRKSKSFSRNISLSLILVALLFGAIFAGVKYLSQHANATLAGFDPGNIIDDATMSNKNSMSEADIQNFLNAKFANNYKAGSPNGYGVAAYPGYQYHVDGGHFVPLAQETFGNNGLPAAGGQKAAHVIWQAAQDYSINPQVLLVILQKEQGLITDNWPNYKQYQSATGFGCPDTAACDPNYGGFIAQIRNAAGFFHQVLSGGWSNYPVGANYIQYNPDKNCGGSVVNVQNRATSALYRYTPYQPNASALAAGWGTGDGCGAYGNRNFYNYFTEWFGSTQSGVLKPLLARYNELGGESGSMGKIIDGGYCNTDRTICWQTFQNGSIVGTKATGFWESRGSVRARWSQLGYQTSGLGFPTSPEVYDGKGWWQNYQGGAIVGTAQTGFWENVGGVRARWSQLGYQGGSMGYPTSPLVRGENNGWWQNFQNGAIVGTDAGGYWESRGGIRSFWGSTGWQVGKYGYPTGPEIWDSSLNGWRQTYQHGVIYYTTARGGWGSQ